MTFSCHIGQIIIMAMCYFPTQGYVLWTEFIFYIFIYLHIIYIFHMTSLSDDMPPCVPPMFISYFHESVIFLRRDMYYGQFICYIFIYLHIIYIFHMTSLSDDMPPCVPPMFINIFMRVLFSHEGICIMDSSFSIYSYIYISYKYFIWQAYLTICLLVYLPCSFHIVKSVYCITFIFYTTRLSVNKTSLCIFHANGRISCVYVPISTVLHGSWNPCRYNYFDEFIVHLCLYKAIVDESLL